MKQIKVTQKYWDSLTEKEQRFLQENVYDFGLQNCKRIITLSRYFGEYDEIVNFSRYNKGEENSFIYATNWLVLKNNHVCGIISKTEGIGITERIKVRMNYDNEFHEVWNNWSKKNPIKSMFANAI